MNWINSWAERATFDHLARPAFRADIEGLRAVAILLVVLYHAKLPGFTGGYVGVDVFFVLSGYLITWLLVDEVRVTGKVDFGRFYARRVRRLLPAVSLVLLVTGMAGALFLAPFEQRLLANSALATASYFSNMYFSYLSTDYFGAAAAAELSPLLHTWSLAVEEQFYLVWPLFVGFALSAATLGLSRDGQARLQPMRLVGGMVVLAALSFLASVYLTSRRQELAFFLAPMRAWEFAVGALALLIPPLAPGIARSLAWLGLVGLGVAVVAFDEETSFPGFAAALPVISTGLVLRVSNSGGVLTRVLGTRPFQIGGRLSYSWYLWHWPIIIFAQVLWPGISLPARLGLLGLSLGLAEMSYRFVEDPLRHARWLAHSKTRSLAFGASLTVAVIVVLLVWQQLSIGWAALPEQARYTAVAETRPAAHVKNCYSGYEETEVIDCQVNPVGVSRRTIVLFGDSHAAQWEPALSTLLDQKKWRLVLVIKTACPIAKIDFVYYALGREYTECTQWREAALARIAEIGPDVVLAASSVAYQVEASTWEEGITSTLSSLSESAGAVILLKDNPRPGFDVPGCLARRAWRRGHPFLQLPTPQCDFDPSNSQREEFFAAERTASAKFDNVKYADLTPVICGGERCAPVEDGTIIYRDTNHLSEEYVRSLTPVVADLVEGVLAKTTEHSSCTDAHIRNLGSARGFWEGLESDVTGCRGGPLT